MSRVSQQSRWRRWLPVGGEIEEEHIPGSAEQNSSSNPGLAD